MSHVRVLLSFQQPKIQKSQDVNEFSAAHAAISIVSSEIMKGRLLKLLLDHPMKVKRWEGRVVAIPLIHVYIYIYTYACIYIYIYTYMNELHGRKV